VRCSWTSSRHSTFSKTHPGRHMEQLGIEPNLITWTGSFMSDRQVKLVLHGKTGEERPVDTGISQRSPAAPNLLVTYVSGIFD